ncbi:MAG TPA: translocation/assembly module TamB domain-containing protein [Terriglobia bacterium]|nr:translocation/assembly module TamB domain-containing protein [Terriglobia bacterium]
MYKQVRRFLYVVLGLAILVLAGLAVANSDWFHAYLERRVTAELHRLTGARVEIGRMHFSLFALEITMNNLVLHGSEEPSAPPLLRAETFAVRLRLLSFPSRQVSLGGLDLNRAEIHIATQADGTTNIPGPILSSAESSARPLEDFLNLAIQRMTINHTDIYWNNQRVSLSATAGDVAVQMRQDRPHAYQGSLSSNSFRFESPQGSLPSTTLSARFEITPGEINVTSFNWRAADFNGQSTIRVKAGANLQTEANFTARGAAPQVARILGLNDFASGEVYVTGRGNYTQGEWQASGRLEGRQILPSWRVFQPGRVEFSAEYSASPEKLLISNLRLAALGGTLTGQGEALFPRGLPRFSLRANVKGAQLSALLASLSYGHPLLNRLRWSSAIGGTLNAAWEGRWEKLDSRIAVNLSGSPNAAGTTLPINGTLLARLTRNRSLSLDIQSLDAQTPHSSLSLQGNLQASNSQLQVDLHTTDFEEWRAPLEFLARPSGPIPLKLEGAVAFSGVLNDNQGSPSIAGQLSMSRFDFRGWKWDELTGRISLSPAAFEIAGGQVSRDNSRLSLSASAALQDWEFGPDQKARVTLQTQRTPLSGLKAALGVNYPLDGLATGQIQLQGTSSALAGDGQILVEKGTLAGRSFDRMAAGIQVVSSIWNLENLRVERGPSLITGKGTFNVSTRAFTASLHASDISLSDFRNPPTPGSTASLLDQVAGRAGFDLDGSGTPDDVRLHAQWTIQDLQVAGNPAGNFRGQLNWQGQTLEAAGESNGAGESLRFSGKAQTAGDWPAEFSGDFSDFRFGPWLHLLLHGKFDSPVTGSGSVKLSGPLRQPKLLVIEGRIQKVDVTSSDIAWANAQPIDLRYTAGTLTISKFRLEGPSTNLEAEGSIRFGEEASLALSAKGVSDAKLLSLLDPAVKATGSSQVDLVVNGTPIHPLLFGKLNVQDLNLTYGDFPIHLFGMTGEIRLEGERATVQSLRGTSGGGTVTVQGYMTFGALPRFDVTAQVDQVRTQYPTDFISQLSGKLRLAGTPENSRMEGELAVRQLHTAPDFTVLSLLSDVGSSSGAPPIGAASPVASKVRLNVQVFSAPTVRPEAQDLTMVADVDLHLQGTLANPVVVGSIHILNGETVVRGNRYKLNRADISMTNPFRTQPMVDLEATTRVQQYDLSLDVSGTLDHFKIGYRSDPPLPTSDILSLLALGYSRQQEQATTTASDRTSTVGASALLSEALSSQTSGRIQRLFGVSRIRIDPNVGGPENIAGARVTVEQQVTRELTLTYITDTGSSQRRVVQFEWQVSDSASMLGIRDRNGIFGVELRFRSRFR